MTIAVEKHGSRGGSLGSAYADAGAEASGADDSTVCNSPGSSERGGGGSLRASSAHSEGGAVSGGGATGNTSEASGGAKPRLRRGRAPANGDGSRQKNGLWSWRSYSPPGSSLRQSSESARHAPEKAADSDALSGTDKGDGDTASVGSTNGTRPPIPAGVDGTDGAGTNAAEAVVRAGGGYLPPRHPLASLNMSPTRSSVEEGAGDVAAACSDREDGGSGPLRRKGVVARGAARTSTKGPAGGATPKAGSRQSPGLGAPTEESRSSGKRPGSGGSVNGRSQSLTGLFSDFADWLMPGMEDRTAARHQTQASGKGTPPSRKVKSAPVTPRGHAPAAGGRTSAAVMREGGWFYNGDSDYSTSDEDASFDSEDEGFWADAGTSDPRSLGGGGGVGILERLRRLFN